MGKSWVLKGAQGRQWGKTKGPKGAKGQGHDHGCTNKVFFGNIMPGMPEAAFLEMVEAKVGRVAMYATYAPAPRWGQSCTTQSWQLLVVRWGL